MSAVEAAAIDKGRRTPPQADQRRVPRAVRERQMLDVARRIFATRGYHAASMEEIAQGVGITKPMLYAYFESKEGLFLACVRHATAHLMDRLEEAVRAERTPELRLWRGLLAVFEFIEEHRESWGLLYPHGPASGGPFAVGAQEASEAMAELLTRLLADTAVAQGVDPEVARRENVPIAHALVAAVEGLGSWWLQHPEEPRDLQALRLMNFAWMGLANLVDGRLWVPPPGA